MCIYGFVEKIQQEGVRNGQGLPSLLFAFLPFSPFLHLAR